MDHLAPSAQFSEKFPSPALTFRARRPPAPPLFETTQVCNALRNDLNHPNEYVRGCTLRFLCKLREPELLEPLIPTVKVRRSFICAMCLLLLWL